jgi:hypothetical protein
LDDDVAEAEEGAVPVGALNVIPYVRQVKPYISKQERRKKRTTAAQRARAADSAFVRSAPWQVLWIHAVELAMNCWFWHKQTLSVALQLPKLADAMHWRAQSDRVI